MIDLDQLIISGLEGSNQEFFIAFIVPVSTVWLLPII